jgi:N-acetyl-anhydromuramoyl-L-alanine amidase
MFRATGTMSLEARCTLTSRVWCDGWWPGAQGRVVSANADERPAGTVVDLVVVHSISLPPGVYGGAEVQALFTNQLDVGAHPYFDQLRGLRVSAHFYVRRTGETLQFVSCDRRAWHAGQSSWRGRSACNDFSIGIELEGLEGTVFEAVQYAALAKLLRALGRRYPIEGVVGHEDVAPGRKQDPGREFDWLALAKLSRVPSRWWVDVRSEALARDVVKKH